MELLFLWIVLGLVIALIARSKGRSGFGWFVYGALIWPVALVHILVLRRTVEAEERHARAEGRIPCPHCAEFVKRQARVCLHCRQDISPAR